MKKSKDKTQPKGHITIVVVVGLRFFSLRLLLPLIVSRIKQPFELPVDACALPAKAEYRSRGLGWDWFLCKGQMWGRVVRGTSRAAVLSSFLGGWS